MRAASKEFGTRLGCLLRPCQLSCPENDREKGHQRMSWAVRKLEGYLEGNSSHERNLIAVSMDRLGIKGDWR